MKNILFSAALVLVACSLSAQREFDTAAELNDFIVEEQAKVTLAIEDLMLVIDNASPKDENSKVLAEAALKKMQAQADESLKEVKELVIYFGEGEFVNATVALFTFYKEAANNQYVEITTLLFSPSYKKKSEEKITALKAETEAKGAALNAQFKIAQMNFAEQFEIELNWEEEEAGE
ncbi:MAG: hypothetical protein H7X71_03315 [Chitinophagales bacterium]|nr:hypothetical protein [Chitinophagales bacterium]